MSRKFRFRCPANVSVPLRGLDFISGEPPACCVALDLVSVPLRGLDFITRRRRIGNGKRGNGVSVPLRGLDFITTVKRMEIDYDFQCFRPLTGIRFHNQDIPLSERKTIQSFRPLTGIRFHNPFLDMIANAGCRCGFPSPYGD